MEMSRNAENMEVLRQIRTVAGDSQVVILWSDFRELELLAGGELELGSLHKRLKVEAPAVDELLIGEVPAYRQAVLISVSKVIIDSKTLPSDSQAQEGEDSLLFGLEV